MKIDSILSIAVVLIAIYIAWAFVAKILTWVIIGGVIYLGYKLFLSGNKRIKK